MSATFLAAATARAHDVAAQALAEQQPPQPMRRPPLASDQIKALAMAMHQRLGTDSPASEMKPELLQRILEELKDLRSQTLGVVIDAGSQWCKVGFAGDAEPRASFPTLISRPCYPGVYVSMTHKDVYVGHEAWSKRRTWRLRHPIERGIVTNWDGMEKVFHHTFYNELRVAPEEQPVLLTEGLLNPKANREMLAQVMFETFNVPAMWLGSRAVLALFAAGRASGLVIESGAQISWAAPVVEGCLVAHAAFALELGGHHITERLTSLLCGVGINLSSTEETRLVADDIKQRLAFVESDYDLACHAADQAAQNERLGGARIACTHYSCPEWFVRMGNPEGFSIRTDVLFRCAEALFSPSLLLVEGAAATLEGSPAAETRGLADIAHDALMACDASVRAELAANVVLAGGTMQLRGVAGRLQRELASLLPAGMEVQVATPTDPQLMVWRGSSYLAWLHLREDLWESAGWIRYDEYDEVGPTIVHRKVGIGCFMTKLLYM
eukprot:646874-Prymnesium_polylepis.1